MQNHIITRELIFKSPYLGMGVGYGIVVYVEPSGQAAERGVFVGMVLKDFQISGKDPNYEFKLVFDILRIPAMTEVKDIYTIRTRPPTSRNTNERCRIQYKQNINKQHTTSTTTTANTSTTTTFGTTKNDSVNNMGNPFENGNKFRNPSQLFLSIERERISNASNKSSLKKSNASNKSSLKKSNPATKYKNKLISGTAEKEWNWNQGYSGGWIDIQKFVNASNTLPTMVNLIKSMGQFNLHDLVHYDYNPLERDDPFIDRDSIRSLNNKLSHPKILKMWKQAFNTDVHDLVTTWFEKRIGNCVVQVFQFNGDFAAFDKELFSNRLGEQVLQIEYRTGCIFAWIAWGIDWGRKIARAVCFCYDVVNNFCQTQEKHDYVSNIYKNEDIIRLEKRRCMLNDVCRGPLNWLSMGLVGEKLEHEWLMIVTNIAYYVLQLESTCTVTFRRFDNVYDADDDGRRGLTNSKAWREKQIWIRGYNTIECVKNYIKSCNAMYSLLHHNCKHFVDEAISYLQVQALIKFFRIQANKTHYHWSSSTITAIKAMTSAEQILRHQNLCSAYIRDIDWCFHL